MFLFLLVVILTVCRACHGGRPLGIDIVTHRENLRFVRGEQTQESECSQMEIVLRSFSIDMEAHFLREWRVARETLAIRTIRNYMEDWEDAAIAVQRRAGRFRLQEKYMGVVIHDKEDGDGDEGYDEVRRICAIVWDRDSRRYKVNTELLRSANVADDVEDMSLNQPYNINSELHRCMKAAKLVPEGANQTSYKLLDRIAAVPAAVPVAVPPPVAAAGAGQ